MDVARTKFARKMAVFPGMIEVIGVAMFVADPAVRPGIHMRSIGVARSFGIIARRSGAADSFGSTFGSASGLGGTTRVIAPRPLVG
jgi:hypothetical protein